jgi:hypothetical protein
LDALRKYNIDQLRIACKDSFTRAKKIIQQHVSSYYLPYSFRRFVIRVGLEQIGDSIKSQSTKEQVVLDFLEKELAAEMESVTNSFKNMAITALFGLGAMAFGYVLNYKSVAYLL